MNALHWLPVAQCVEHKVAVMTFSCLSGTRPEYFRDVCRPVSEVAGRAGLRSASSNDLVVPRSRGKRYGPRSFRVSAPTVWNSLPADIRSHNIGREQFRRGLKTFLFDRAYYTSEALL